jgi:hypothetical protein
MTTDQAIAFVRKHGVVLASGKGPVPNVAEAVAAEPISGSWWGHPEGRKIFRVLQHLRASPEILVCRAVGGKVTFVHRRLWPALVRVSKLFLAQRLAQVHEEHTASGAHVTHDVAYPEWVPAEVTEQARELDQEQALDLLGRWARSSK